MTAIAVAYDLRASRFVIAADGRCASDTVPMVIKTDTQQKIFPSQSQYMNIVYSMSGVAMTDDGSFETIAEAEKQITMLSGRRFIDGYEYAAKFCFNMARVLEKAERSGRIPAIPTSEKLPHEEKGKIFTFFLCGYYKGLPFLKIASFYHDEVKNRINIRPEDFELSQSRLACTGSEKIASMIYGDAAVDPRIAKYKHDPNNDAYGLEATAAFIKACSDPAVLQIDPWCRIVGGHLHAAELTKNGFRWLISPVT